MPTCTPVYRFTYPIGSDRPCDVGETLCELVTGVEAELDRFDRIVARTNTAIPMAKVSISAPQPLGLIVSFDTVEEDTDSMVDFTTSRDFVFARRTGVYRVRLYVEVGTTGSASSSDIIQVDAAGPILSSSTISPQSNPILQVNDPNLADSISYTLTALYRVTLVDSRFFGQVNVGSVAGTPTTVNRAELDVEWMADL